jgi:hypothetical protein
MSGLDDAMQEHMANLVFVESRPFTYAEFLRFHVNEKEYNMTHGTFRNKISKFIKSDTVEVAYRSGPTFYTLNGMKFGKQNLMTLDHTMVSSSTNNPIYKLIKDLPMDKHALHNIRLRFEVQGIWSLIYLQNYELKVDATSKDITLKSWNFDGLFLRTVVHKTDTVSVIVGCTYGPVAVDINGIIRLTEELTRVEERLSVLVNNLPVVVPPHSTWIVTIWHFGADSLTGYSGQRFEVTWETGKNSLIRVYSKGMKELGTKIRLERQEYPCKNLADAIEEKLTGRQGVANC